jgi:hypothetical protein
MALLAVAEEVVGAVVRNRHVCRCDVRISEERKKINEKSSVTERNRIWGDSHTARLWLFRPWMELTRSPQTPGGKVAEVRFSARMRRP